jgi:hypothetical protein
MAPLGECDAGRSLEDAMWGAAMRCGALFGDATQVLEGCASWGMRCKALLGRRDAGRSLGMRSTPWCDVGCFLGDVMRGAPWGMR